MITVYYDGKCLLCNREINYYKSISNKNTFKWLDIANHPNELKSIQITQSDALRYLHVKDEFSKMHIGVDAFIVIWKNLRYWRLLAIIISIPVIKHFSMFIYKKFANYRFSKLSHCQISVKR